MLAEIFDPDGFIDTSPPDSWTQCTLGVPAFSWTAVARIAGPSARPPFGREIVDVYFDHGVRIDGDGGRLASVPQTARDEAAVPPQRVP